MLSRTNIEEIIKFAHKEELFIFADEVRRCRNINCSLSTLRTSNTSMFLEAYQVSVIEIILVNIRYTLCVTFISRNRSFKSHTAEWWLCFNLGVLFCYQETSVSKSLTATGEVMPWWKTGTIDIEVKEELVTDSDFVVDANKRIEVSNNNCISQIF